VKESLEDDREYLLRSLDDLEREHDAGDLDDADYKALKEDYTARAAQVLRALGRRDDPGVGDPGPVTGGDELAARAPDGTAGDGAPGLGRPARVAAGGVTVAGATAPRPRWRPVLVGAALLAFAAGTGALVARSAGERTPGAPASGSIAATGPSGGIADQLAEAREHIDAGRTLDAIKVFDRIIEKDPEQPEALAYRGWLLRLAGRSAGNTALIDKGMEYIERAVAADPTYPDAHFFRAFVLYQDRKDPAAAVPELRAFLAGNPPAGMVAVVEDLLSRALAESEGATPGPPAAGPAPSTTPAPTATAPAG